MAAVARARHPRRLRALFVLVYMPAHFPRCRRPQRRWAAVGVIGPIFAAAVACHGDAPVPATSANDFGGTVIVATAADPGALLPPLATSTQASAVVDQVFDRLADLGDSLNTIGDRGFRPRLSDRWTWAKDSLSVSFHLAPAARWHDGTPVRARDVAFSFALYTDPVTASPLAPLLSNVDSVTATDSLTVTFWYKRRFPTQFFDVTYNLYVLPEHLLARTPRDRLIESPFARHPIGSGRFRFVSWTPNQRLEIAADANNYRGRPRLDRVVWSVAPDFGTATIQLLAGDADFIESLRAESFGQTARLRTVRLVPYPSLDYGFLQFNLHAVDGSPRPHRLFADRALRRALTMAVDRERIVRNVFDSLAYVAIGPVPRALFSDWRQIRQLPYNVVAARALLDTLGWQMGADGMRVRGGVPLAFTVLVPTSSAVRQRLAVLLQEQLRLVGARVTIQPLDFGAFGEHQRTHTFDAVIGGWHTDPSPVSIRQTWGSVGARLPGGSNFGSYESAAFDAQVDSALFTSDPARARPHWLRAYQIIVDDAPAIWLFEPRLVAGVHRRLHVVGLRADGWWTYLADWFIPARERIGRDRVGLR
ncbi:MAG: ABC transporter substrate-binding protein [Candidatus Eremiobacteraeota bacterium]|nr:ABC transporter substrate-binding protein [Candidatus Eremiobacteraeota bacterium]